MGRENDTEADRLITSYPLGPIDDVAWTLDILIGLVMEEILLDFRRRLTRMLAELQKNV